MENSATGPEVQQGTSLRCWPSASRGWGPQSLEHRPKIIALLCFLLCGGTNNSRLSCVLRNGSQLETRILEDRPDISTRPVWENKHFIFEVRYKGWNQEDRIKGDSNAVLLREGGYHDPTEMKMQEPGPGQRHDRQHATNAIVQGSAGFMGARVRVTTRTFAREQK